MSVTVTEKEYIIYSLNWFFDEYSNDMDCLERCDIEKLTKMIIQIFGELNDKR